MNRKILLAFLAGAVLASEIVYVAVRNDAPPKPATATVTRVSTPAPPIVSVRAAEVLPEPVQPARTAKREKPTAMPQPRWEMAQVQAPPQRPQVEPVVETAAVAAPVYVPPVPVAPVPAPVAPPAEPEPAPEPPARPEPQLHSVIIRPGTVLVVRIGETLAGDRNKPGDEFLATLDQPLVVDGWVIAERGARLEGKVVDVDRAYLKIELVKVTTSDNQRVHIRTAAYEKQGASSAGRQAATVGVGAAIGAAIGGLAGGGKGAGIGAGVGAAAGAGDVILARRPVQIPVEARVTFKVQDPVTITERLN